MDYRKKYITLLRAVLKNNPNFTDSEVDSMNDWKAEKTFDAVYDFLFMDDAFFKPKPKEKIERINPATIFDSIKTKYTKID